MGSPFDCNQALIRSKITTWALYFLRLPFSKSQEDALSLEHTNRFKYSTGISKPNRSRYTVMIVSYEVANSLLREHPGLQIAIQICP